MDKVWLVTGSASGLGRNIAEAVLESGDRLVATARDPRRLDDLVNKFGERVRAVSLDVADESAAQAAVQVALDAFVRLDVVVNNAGFGDIAPFEQLSAERFKAVIDTNFYGVVNVTRAAVPHMRKQRSGCILQDIVGRRPPDPTWQHALPCSEMGCWRLYGVSCPGTVPVRGEGLRPGTRRNADELGCPREPGHARTP